MADIRKPPRRVTLPLASLIDNPRNYKIHPVSQLNKLVASIKKNGQPRPILAREANRMVIGGHGIKAAMLMAGETEALVDLWDVDQKTADEFLITDNRTAELSRTDDARLRELLGGTDPADYSALGFDPEEIEKILAETEEDLVIAEIETGDVGDTFWVTILGPLRHQARILAGFQEIIDAEKLEGVEVQIGTTTPGA